MDKTKKAAIENYRQRILNASKELPKKEIFKDLVRKLYAGDAAIEEVLDRMSAGAEKAIVNIPRKNKTHRGSADTLYNNIIIEFEASLSKNYAHAKEQLAGYLLGEYKSGKGYNYTLIASDLINWRIVAPELEAVERLDVLQEHELAEKLRDVRTASFTLTEHNGEDFYYWIDRYLFKQVKQKATLDLIKEAFGSQSTVFLESYRLMSEWFGEAKKFGEVQVSYEQWKKFLSIAYGSFDASEAAFLVHTYLSVFAKMMAYSVIRPEDDFIDDKEMLGILDGSIFNDHNIRNFVDNDFFHWVKSDRNYGQLKKAFRIIAQEISTFDFEAVDEDILKGVYQELIDLDTRHALGEYYTPDWLCERVVSEYDFQPSSRILDPSCGSGSFLRAAVHRLKDLHPDITIEQLSSAVYGIDIHPLSVQIAKTTMLIALGKGIRNEKKPIRINIILANTLLAPEGVGTLYGTDFTMAIDKHKLKVNTAVLNEVGLFDEALEVADHLAEATMNGPKESITGFERTLRAQYKKPGIEKAIVESFYLIYENLKVVKEKGRDSIWKFIIQNLYKPYFLAKYFDYIIGNPPWFTYSSIKNEDYQDTLNKLAVAQMVKPARVANFPHLEIAAIFLSYCTTYFLKEGGQLAFVLPRAFFSADHHDNTRNGTAKGFRLNGIWDLDGVTPLFNVPSCVLFAEKAEVRRKIPGTGVAGKSFSGRLPAHNATLAEAAPRLKEEDTQWYYIQQGKASAFSAKKKKAQTKVNAYKSEFKQGATLVPRTFYFVEVTGEMPPDWEDRVLNLRTSEAVKPDAKAPWKALELEGRMESKYLFRTALSKSILPYALYQPDLVALPIQVRVDAHGFKRIAMQTPVDIRRDGGMYAANWFSKTEALWNVHRTEKNTKITASDYANWQNKITVQNLNEPFLVLYNTSGKDANAVVIEREKLDLHFVVDYTTYGMYPKTLDEAYYLTALLNSSIPNEAMKDFQARGLFGARHVSKKILDVYFPRYDATNSIHQQLAVLSEAAHQKAAQFLADNPPAQALSAIFLGRLRSAIKKHLSKEREVMDKLVKKVIG